MKENCGGKSELLIIYRRHFGGHPKENQTAEGE